MDQTQFWHIIEQAKVESAGDQARQVELVKDQLRALSLEEVGVFDRIFHAYHSRSYSAALWRTLNELRDTGDDGYEYFRAWLIGQGQGVFSEVTQHPGRLHEFIEADGDWWLEDLWYVAEMVYEEKTGQSLWDLLKERGEEPYPLVGWEWLKADTIRSGDL